jgi:hypothetical protein
LLAFKPDVALLAPAALLAGLAFSLGAVVWDTAIQRTIAPDKLSRVAAYGWMGAMIFLPAGYALAGPISSVIGVKADLVIAAAWIVISTVFIMRLSDVRDFTLEESTETPPVPVPS